MSKEVFVREVPTIIAQHKDEVQVISDDAGFDYILYVDPLRCLWWDKTWQNKRGVKLFYWRETRFSSNSNTSLPKMTMSRLSEFLPNFKFRLARLVGIDLFWHIAKAMSSKRGPQRLSGRYL